MGWVSDGGDAESDSDTMDGCAATHGRDASHPIAIDNTTQNPAGNVRQYPDKAQGEYETYVRFYFKESGLSSTRCPSGVGNCPAFKQYGSNGYKAVEYFGQCGADTPCGGIGGQILGTTNVPGSGGRELFGAGFDCGTTETKWTGRQYGDSTVSWDYDGSPAPHAGTQFVHADYRDEWIFIEILHTVGRSDGRVKLWMDTCGKDGLGCTGTPTLRVDSNEEHPYVEGVSGQDMVPTSGNCFWPTTGISINDQRVRYLWFNFWNKRMNGEIQFDEIVVRDASITDEPIGFAPIMSNAVGMTGGALSGGKLQ
jgi:hypothetical protein